MAFDPALNDRIAVLFIGGYGRSGSTLLDRVLGQGGGFFSAGELHHVWERGFLQNESCGCGEPFRECGFWSRVIDRVFPDLTEEQLARILMAKRSVGRTRQVPQLSFPALRSTGFGHQLLIYRRALHRLYSGIQDVSQCRVIVDSSKDPAHGFMLQSMDEIDLRVIHLVRDSRAVAHSWKRHKVRPEIYWKREEMPRFGVLNSAITWDWMNVATGLLLRRAERGLRVNYESFATSPPKIIEGILASLDLPTDDPPCKNENDAVWLEASHMVAGNPLRFQTGPTRIEPDEEWRRRLHPTKRLAVTTLTAPLLRHYGYSLRVRQSP